jgi:hypothetical protein
MRRSSPPESSVAIRRNAITDDANSTVAFAPEKSLPLGISDKEGAAVTNRARGPTAWQTKFIAEASEESILATHVLPVSIRVND